MLYKLSPSSVSLLTLCCLGLSACGGTSAVPVAPSAANASTLSATDRESQSSSMARSVLPTNSVENAASADQFVDSIGVDTHFNYGQSSYRTSYAAIRAALVNSGIRHVQDGGFGYSNPLALTYLGEHGISHSAGFPVNVTAAQITQTLQSNAPYVDVVEPQNEFDETSKTNPNWASQIVSEQQLLYTTVKSNPAFAHITVLGPSFGHPWNAAAVGNLDGYEDAGSEHDYTCNDNPGTTLGDGIGPVTALLRSATGTKPMWTTEVGYADNATNWGCALADSTIAKFDPRAIADRWIAGQARTYFYQFADTAPGLNYDSMGLVTADGRAKPQYTAIKNMIALLTDPGATFTPAPLGLGLASNASNVQHLLLQKRDGSYYLMLWLEVPGWDTTTAAAVHAAPQTVTLNFTKPPTNATSYTYAPNWTLGATGLQPASSMTIPVTDAITFVHLHF